MSSQSFSPKFVRAKVALKFDNEFVPVGEHLINAEGLPGFPWDRFDPLEMVGTQTTVKIEGLTDPGFEFSCGAYFTCERTTKGSSLGLTFILGDREKKILSDAIAREGQLPEFARKFPRIAFNEMVTIMPSHGILRFFHHNEDISIACDVDDFSPSGFQLSTEDPRAAALEPGGTVRVQIQPRGDYKHAIQSNATAQRVIYKVDPATGNYRWHFGLSVTTMSGDHKAHFTELLKLIVMRFKGL